jgi:hypothetical protein
MYVVEYQTSDLKVIYLNSFILIHDEKALERNPGAVSSQDKDVAFVKTSIGANPFVANP